MLESYLSTLTSQPPAMPSSPKRRLLTLSQPSPLTASASSLPSPLPASAPLQQLSPKRRQYKRPQDLSSQPLTPSQSSPFSASRTLSRSPAANSPAVNQYSAPAFSPPHASAPPRASVPPRAFSPPLASAPACALAPAPARTHSVPPAPTNAAVPPLQLLSLRSEDESSVSLATTGDSTYRTSLRSGSVSQGREQEAGDSTYRTSSVSLHLGDSARTDTTTATVTPGPEDLQQVNYQMDCTSS